MTNQQATAVSLRDTVCKHITSFTRGASYKKIAYEILSSDMEYYFGLIYQRVLEATNEITPNGPVSTKFIHQTVDFWVYRIAIDYLSSIGRALDVYEEIAMSDMENALSELNVGIYNHQNINSSIYDVSNTTSNRSIFTTDSSNAFPRNTGTNINNYVETKSDDNILNMLNDAKPAEDYVPQQDFEVIDDSINNSNPFVTSKNNDLITPLRDNPIVVNEVFSTDEYTPPVKQHDVELVEYTNMTDDERMDYIAHELNKTELRQLHSLKTITKEIPQLVEQERQAEKPQAIIKTKDMYLVNKVVYVNQVADIAGSDEYYDSIHADGKGVISIFGEYGASSGVYINNDAIRKTILEFNNKIFGVDNLDTLVKQLKDSGRGGNILCNSINYKIVQWVQDLIKLPIKQHTFPLLLTGKFKQDLSEYLDYVGVGDTSAYDILTNRLQTIQKYIPVFKNVSELYMENKHLPIMDLIPTDEYNKCIIPINYTAMVRIPVDFKAMGLDAMHCAEKHFIAKRSSYEQFYLLEESVLEIIKSIDSNINNIKLNIADTTNHVVTFKRIEDSVGTIKVNDR